VVVSGTVDDSVRVAEGPATVEVTLAADVLFRAGGAELSTEARPRLAEAAGRIRRARPDRVEVEGHTDGGVRGADARRESLAWAETVASALEDMLGAAAPVFDVAGRGASDPVAVEGRGGPAAQRRARAANRRVVVRFGR
jgi:outer membrane protein OmpA-like peptidoglycan-associated protein